VYWEDTDAGGIVYYANYLKFLERARTEWLRALGVEQELLKEQDGSMFVVVDIEAHFRRPARYGELLEVTVQVAESGRASLTFEQRILRGKDPSAAELLLDSKVRVACLDAATLKPRALPDAIVQEIGNDR
jgi:acyl-CoA thioester hydrolase